MPEEFETIVISENDLIIGEMIKSGVGTSARVLRTLREDVWVDYYQRGLNEMGKKGYFLAGKRMIRQRMYFIFQRLKDEGNDC